MPRFVLARISVCLTTLLLQCVRSDLSSNKLASLDGLEFPSNLKTLILEVNSITSASASDFPSGLQTLYVLLTLFGLRFCVCKSPLLRLFLTGCRPTLCVHAFGRYLSKNGVDTLASFRFPAQLKSLRFNGNAGLQTLTGAVLPEALETLYVPNAQVFLSLVLCSALTRFFVRLFPK